jgi:hypothetical protein
MSTQTDLGGTVEWCFRLMDGKCDRLFNVEDLENAIAKKP